jgi:hypothetical protein
MARVAARHKRHHNLIPTQVRLMLSTFRGPIRHAAIAALAVQLAGLTSAAAPRAQAAVSLQSFPATTAGIHRFMGIQSDPGHSFTASELAAIAKEDDILVALQVQISKYGAALRATNPGLRMFAYQNGMFAQSNQGSTFPNSWYLYDRYGKKVQSKSNHNYLMNPYSTATYQGSAGWAAYVAHQCQAKVAAASLATGCYLDQVSSAGDTGFVTSLPIDPSTGKPFTLSAYMAAVNRVINAAAAKTVVIGNSYESANRYYQNSTDAVDSTNGTVFEAEHWMGATQPRDAETLSMWKMDVQMLIDSQKHGHGAMVNFEDMSTNLSQWQGFVVATMLLGNNGHVWVHFASSSSSGPDALQLNTPLMNAPIGSPTETFTTTDGYLKGGVYQRSFTKGRVLVNPGGAAVTVKLAATMTTISGTRVNSLQLAPYSGTVLLL